jgi:hypothetical protein
VRGAEKGGDELGAGGSWREPARSCTGFVSRAGLAICRSAVGLLLGGLSRRNMFSTRSPSARCLAAATCVFEACNQ